MIHVDQTFESEAEYQVWILARAFDVKLKRGTARAGLTKKQRQVLEFVKQFTTETSISPTLDEICAGCGMKSKSQAHHVLTGLRERGYVEWIPHRVRSICVLGE